MRNTRLRMVDAGEERIREGLMSMTGKILNGICRSQALEIQQIQGMDMDCVKQDEENTGLYVIYLLRYSGYAYIIITGTKKGD